MKFEQWYNFENSKTSWGLWRYTPGGVIHEEQFIYGEGVIGPYKVPEYFKYDEYWTRKMPTLEKHELYKRMVNSEDMLAIYMVNNVHFAEIYRDSIRYENSYKPLESKIYLLADLEWRRAVPVGWVKTKCTCPSVRMYPYHLDYDVSTSEVYVGNGIWVRATPMITTNPDFQLYKDMLKVGACAVYVDYETGEVVYLKEDGSCLK